MCVTFVFLIDASSGSHLALRDYYFGLSLMFFTRYSCKICHLTLIGTDKGLRSVQFAGQSDEAYSFDGHQETGRPFIEVIEQLTEYCAGVRKSFDLDLDPAPQPSWRSRVLEKLQSIPYGTTCTYGDIAGLLNASQWTAARAVGQALSKNPLPIIIPCHRVVGANGSLTGYAGGIEVKQKLIDLEHSFT